MNVKTTLISTMACLLLMASSAAAGETDKERALKNGAVQLTADEIAERFAGKTVTFESAKSGKRTLVYYGEGNEAAAQRIGGDWSDTGFYGITDRNTICLSWKNRDKPRLRCMDVLVVDEVVQKFRADGSLSGSIVKFEDGKIL